MKKVILTLAVLFCALNASAQDGWTVGGRIGSGFQAVTSYHGLGEVANYPFYLEGRFGMSWLSAAGVTADFTALAAWRIFEFGNYSAGNFFADFGCGINVGGREHYAYVGPCGLARIGFKFTGAPVSLSFDWTPVFGAEISYWKGYTTSLGDYYEGDIPGGEFVHVPGGSHSQFYTHGLANFGITCTYNF